LQSLTNPSFIFPLYNRAITEFLLQLHPFWFFLNHLSAAKDLPLLVEWKRVEDSEGGAQFVLPLR